MLSIRYLKFGGVRRRLAHGSQPRTRREYPAQPGERAALFGNLAILQLCRPGIDHRFHRAHGLDPGG